MTDNSMATAAEDLIPLPDLDVVEEMQLGIVNGFAETHKKKAEGKMKETTTCHPFRRTPGRTMPSGSIATASTNGRR